jgi:hypothetical protein
MLSENTIDRINKILSNKTFRYVDEVIPNVDFKVDIRYTFKAVGYRKMMSVGEYYDYLKIDVIITELNDSFSKLIFGFDEEHKHLDLHKMYETQLYPFYGNLSLKISQFFKVFDSNIKITIDDLKFDLKTPENITESRMSKVAIRTTVTDIVHKLKDGKEGYFMLPGEDGEEYEFTNLPFKYGVELTLEIDDEMDGYKMNGEYSYEYDDTISVIELIIRYNPKTLRKNFYNIIGELNDIVAHELEHAFQYNRDGHIRQERPIESFKYYTQPHEIGAQRVGFRRVAKLRKLPYNDVVKDWFDTHKDIHGLTDDEMEQVIQIIINGK